MSTHQLKDGLKKVIYFLNNILLYQLMLINIGIVLLLSHQFHYLHNLNYVKLFILIPYFKKNLYSHKLSKRNNLS
jgi:hypothetical protein